MKNIFFLSFGLLVSSFFLQSCDTTTSNGTVGDKTQSQKQPKVMDNGLMNIMENAMRDMKVMSLSGDFDLDFAKMMKIHHQAAVDMSKIELAKGDNAEVKTMAQNILNAQKAEIAELQMFIDKHKMSAMNQHDKMHDQLMTSMKDMEEDMKMMKMTEDVDKHYVSMMIPHHESAVDMAQMQLKHGGNEALKKMAQMMINDQTKEIAAFKDWMNRS